jgi:hypothetical protein
MAESWYYTQGGHRMGPVPLAELQSLVASTRVKGLELAWTAGMQDWARVVDLPILKDPTFRRPGTPPPPTPVGAGATPTPVEASATEVSTETALSPATHQIPSPPYVVPRTSLYGPVLLPPRPAATFVDHAEPRGDAADWPVTDEQLLQLELTGDLRRSVTAAAMLYWMLTILTAICGVAMLVVSLCLFALVASANNPAPGYLLFAGIMFAFTAMLFFATRFTSRSNRAAPATMMAMFGILTVMNIAGVIGLLRQDPVNAVYCGIGAAASVVFATVSFRAFAAIPEFRRQPAWCQEILIRAKV